MRNIMRKFRKDQDGAAMVEYAVLLGIITAASIVSIGFIGGQVAQVFATVNAALTTAGITG